MKRILSLCNILMLIGIVLLPLGCGQKSENSEHGEESPSGAAFKPGKGIMLTDETSKILGLKTTDVVEEALPQVVQLNVQIFGETHRFSEVNVDHTGCDVHGSGFVPPDKAHLIKAQQKVKLKTTANEMLEGFVVAVQEPLAHGEIEVIVGVTTAGSKLKDGEFVTAVISAPRSEPVTVIPKSALLRTAEGTFVYVVNGDAYYRTAVKAGSSTDEKIEVTDGLYAGDQVVTNPVETLWIIELRATKGGGHSH